MFDTTFAADIPLAIRFLLAFLVVLGVMGGTAWAMRQFGRGRLPGANPRSRLPRLAVIDSVGIDRRRRLVLVRRDHVEHLLLINGPTDLVVESNIVYANTMPHDVPAAHLPSAAAHLPSAAAHLPRALLRRDTGSRPLSPLKPEVTPPQEPELSPEDPAASLSNAEKSARLQHQALAARADELSARMPAPRVNPSSLPGRFQLSLAPRLGQKRTSRCRSNPALNRGPSRRLPHRGWSLRSPHPWQTKTWPKWRIVSKQHCAS
jgi:flagellar protein FliO/FliZ